MEGMSASTSTAPVVAAPDGTLRRGKGAGGGQFAGHTPVRPAVALTEPPDPDRLPDAAPYGWEDEAYRVFRRAASRVIRRYGLDRTLIDDAVQDAWLDLMGRRDFKEGGLDGLRRLTQSPQLLTLVAATVTKAHYYGGGGTGLRHEDVNARRQLRVDEAAFRELNGRGMTPTERRDAADRVRLSFPAGRRPHPDFYEEHHLYSLDRLRGDGDGDTFGDLLDDTYRPPGRDQDGNDPAEDAIGRLEEAGRKLAAARRAERDNIWGTVAGPHGAPAPRPGVFRSRDAARKAHAALIDRHGGAAQVAGRWLDGLSDPDEEDALFAPFGIPAADMDARDKVARVFRRHPTFAEDLWDAAARKATA